MTARSHQAVFIKKTWCIRKKKPWWLDPRKQTNHPASTCLLVAWHDTSFVICKDHSSSSLHSRVKPAFIASIPPLLQAQVHFHTIFLFSGGVLPAVQDSGVLRGAFAISHWPICSSYAARKSYWARCLLNSLTSSWCLAFQHIKCPPTQPQ